MSSSPTRIRSEVPLPILAPGSPVQRDLGASSRAAPASAIYEGWVTHRRTEPIEHSFRYRVFLPLLDLGELPGLLDRHPLWSARRPAPAWIRRSDFLPDQPGPLGEAARSTVAEQTGRRPEGAVRMLSNPRYLGLGFNPVSFYFLYNRPADTVEALLAEVTNTPWGERRCYSIGRNEAGRLDGRVEKRMHVSPFMPMDQTYAMSATEPGDSLHVRIANQQEGRTIHEASLALRRRELTQRELSRVLLAYPPMTLAVMARIYLNALKLKLKGAPVIPHPGSGRG